MRTMDIEITATHCNATQEDEQQLCVVRDENKLLKEKLQSLRTAPTREPSLDVCRGFATAMMILVKHVGNSFPVMSYAPWDGINLADFGPPMFLFLAGASTALAHNSNRSRVHATGVAFRRSAWLFCLGILLEGSFFHKESLSFGIDSAKFRVFGTLQRIALAKLCTSLCEIWAPVYTDSQDSKTYYLHWTMMALLSAASAAILYGLHVPDWSFSLQSATRNIYDKTHNSYPCITGDITTYMNATNGVVTSLTGESLSASIKNITYGTLDTTSTTKVVCGMRGFSNTEPACNAAAHIDRLILGLNHMNPKPWYKHLPLCRENEAPDWCDAPFESEGILSTLSATVTSLIGLHFGHVMVQSKHQHLTRLWSWTLPSASLIIVGVTLHNVGLSFNRQLYSFSYLCFTAGTAGTVLSTVYLFVEANGWRSVFSEFLEFIGRHSLLIFGLLQCDVLQILLQGFYHKCPQNNVLSCLRNHHGMLTWLPSL